MKKVVVASENPVKISVAKKAFLSVYPEDEFEFIAIKSESGVGDQPINEETQQGALNRLDYIKENYPDADFWISQEGGLCEDGDRLFNRAWIVVCDKNGYVSKSSTSAFYLPSKITEYVKQGIELGVANDKFFNSINSKHGIGAVGYLTDGLIDRELYYLHSAIIALSEIKHQEWFIAT